MVKTAGEAVRRLAEVAREAVDLVAHAEGEPLTAARLLMAAAEVRRLAFGISDGAVAVLRAAGWTWAEVGDVLGVSRQAVQQRWGDQDSSSSGP